MMRPIEFVEEAESVAKGEEVPIPNLLFVSSKKKLVLSSVTAEPEVKSTEPVVYEEGVSERPRKVPSPRPEPTQTSLIAKHPAEILAPLLSVVVAPPLYSKAPPVTVK